MTKTASWAPNGEMNQADGLLNAAGHLGAMRQRGEQIAQQKKLAAAAKKSAEIENERLALEKKRFEAQEAWLVLPLPFGSLPFSAEDMLPPMYETLSVVVTPRLARKAESGCNLTPYGGGGRA